MNERNKVKQKIEMLIREFKNNPDKFLTEENIRSYFYHLLLGDFNIVRNCENDSRSIPLHTEIRWYGQSGRLKLRSDIVIMDVSTLRTTDDNGLRLPLKGYSFNKPKIVIEVKMRRKGSETDTAFINKIRKDWVKIRTLNSELGNDFYSFIVIFDKKKNLDLELERQNNHKEYYVYPYAERGN